MSTVGCHADDREQYDIVKGFAGILEPINVLEIGCGHMRFKGLFVDYTGIDSNPSVHPDEVMNATNLQFPDRSFDMVLSCTVLMHIKDTVAIEEVQRVADRYILLIETARWIGRAKPHKYEVLLSEFTKVLELALVTSGSPLHVWLFKRRR